MKIRPITRFFLLLSLVAVLVLAAACGDTKDPDPTPTPDPAPSADIVFSATATPEVRIVYGTTGEGMVADKIAARLRALGMTVTTKAAADLTEGETYHILVGATGKPETAAVQTKVSAACKAGDLYWYLAAESGKLVVLASNNEYYTKAVTTLQQHETADSLTIASDLLENYVYTLEQQKADEEEKKRQEEEAKRQEEAKKLAELDEAWDTRFDHITDANINTAIRNLYSHYDPEKLALWFAHLYDPVSGGFYYANSARDYNGFLADMESTYQISGMVKNGMFGLAGNLKEFYGADISAKMISFYQSMQDPETGYFIHPQFGKALTMSKVMRYSRDLDWAIAMLKDLGSKPLYATPFERVSATAYTDTVGRRQLTVTSLVGTAPYREEPVLLATAEGWEANEASVRAYVNNLLNTQSSEAWSNTLSTQRSMFVAAGVLDYVLDVLDERVNPDYGLWVKSKNADGSYVNFIDKTEPAYGIYTVTYKLLVLYNDSQGREFKHVTKMMENAIECITSRKSAIRVTYLYNPWATLTNLRSNLNTYGTAEARAAFNAAMSENAVEMINSTLANLDDFRHEDGSYSFLPGKSSPEIYGTPVSLGYDEGDVNGTLIGVSAMTSAICGSLGYVRVPLFNYHHGQTMLKAMKAAQPIEKQEQTTRIFDYDMEADTIPSGISIATGEGGRLEIVTDPTKPTNRVLRLVKDTEKNVGGQAATVKLIEGNKMNEGDIIRTSFRFNLTSDTRFGNQISDKNNPNILQIRFSTGAGNLYMPVFRFANNAQGFQLADNKSTGGGYVGYPMGKEKVLNFDTWYELTFEFYITGIGTDDKTFRAVIYLDGEKVGESTAFYSDSGKDTADGGKVAFDLKRLNLDLHPQMRIHADILFDDFKTVIITPSAE